MSRFLTRCIFPFANSLTGDCLNSVFGYSPTNTNFRKVHLSAMVLISVIIIATFLSIILTPTGASAAIVQATSCSYGDVTTAVAAASAGDTVAIPAGTCSWESNKLSISKAISIVGAGSGSSESCNGSVSTCISGTGTLLLISTPLTPQAFPFRLSGLYLSTTASVNYGHIIDITGAGRDWRIDNNYLHHTYGVNGVNKALIGVTANVAYWTLFGLIDSNTFKNVYIYLGGGTGSAEHGWMQPAQWGQDTALFIENNHFDGSDSTLLGVGVDNQNGGRATIRYNIFDDMYLMIHSACQTTVRGGRSYEVYANLFRGTLSPSKSMPYYVSLRAGSALITRNHVAGSWTWGGGNQGYVAVDNRRSWFDTACKPYFGDCNGTSVYDSNLANSAKNGAFDGYRCLDQIGSGMQTGFLGNGQKQELDPLYVWSNTSGKVCLSGSDRYKRCTADSDCANNDCSTQILTPNNVYKINDKNNQPFHIVSGRDYYDAATGNNSKASYAAHICPHPLAGPGSCDTGIAGKSGYTIGIQPPANLKITN